MGPSYSMYMNTYRVAITVNDDIILCLTTGHGIEDSYNTTVLLDSYIQLHYDIYLLLVWCIVHVTI